MTTYPSKLIPSRVLASLTCLCIAGPSLAEMQPSLSLSGQPGLIDMPGLR